MEHQFRRGIYRPNAQRLSISLAPLVAQRSLMFRVQTDLATKASYAELTPTEESPALYSLTESAQIISAVMTAISTAMSSASVYSQDSWKTESPFVPVVKVDPRRMAIAFSPSVQWSDMGEGYSGKTFRVESPLVHSSFILQPDVSFSEDNDTKTSSEASLVSSVANAVHKPVRSPGSPIPVKNKQSKLTKSRNLQSAKRHKSAFHKVMFLFQPSKRELAQAGGVNPVTMPNDLQLMDFNLPDFRVSPIPYSFIDHTSTYPSLSRVSTTSSMAPSPDTPVENGGKDAARVRRLHETMPPVISPGKKIHRRYRSSPAVPYFPGRWDKTNMPPLPVRPLDSTLSKA